MKELLTIEQNIIVWDHKTVFPENLRKNIQYELY